VRDGWVESVDWWMTELVREPLKFSHCELLLWETGSWGTGIVWHICSVQELLSHRGLGAHAQRESCGLYQRIARWQLFKHLDCATMSRGHVTSEFPQMTSHTPAPSPWLHNARYTLFHTRLWCHTTVKRAAFSACPFEGLWERLEFLRSRSEFVKRYERSTRSTEEYRRSACEDLMCD
jgi:hypothetical protein